MDIIQFFGRFHVLVLHLPIGILLMSALMEIFYAVKNKPRNSLLTWVWFWGALSAIGACTLGYMLSLGGGYSDDAVFIHKSFGISVAVCSIICWIYFGLFLSKKIPNKKANTKTNKVVISALASLQLFLLFSTGHYGANMTHGETYLVEHAPNVVRVLAGFEPHKEPRPPITSIAQAETYADLIEPIFKQRCVSCHNDGKQKGKLNLASIKGIEKGGRSGKTFGNSINKSELYKRITMDSHDKKYMPAEGKTPLSDEQVQTIAWWINAGSPTSGMVTDHTLSSDSKLAIMRALGLTPKAGSWPLAKVEPLSVETVRDLQSHGFVVKTIAKNVNYIDVDLSSASEGLTPEALASLLKAKSHIAYLNLVNSNVTDKQLKQLAQLTYLIKMRLEKNSVTSKGINALSPLINLEYLNLYKTAVDDEALSALETLPKLKAVYVGQTQITPTSASSFNDKAKQNIILGLSIPSNTNKKA
ncbi:c-type cytochrome [Colwellia sp. UCD-KL20]|uniref:c-type cytochrome n=1 Tax=Colwellia sp. UCD-KL20 TaxID=1917165 RepID=UPI0009713DE6|nr:c-type cytochrome [Colwellia sp. UCD-KL20]